MSPKKTGIPSPQTKKELKKEIAEKMEAALPEMKTKLGNKKFQQRIKKAAKIITHGLHTKDISADNGKPKTAAAAPAKNIKTLKKINTKKS
ncbi:MAG: hypothetical protein ABI405_09610 [Parafilimonas sp.]